MDNLPADFNAERAAHEASELVRMARSHTGLQVKRCNVPMTPRDETRQRNLRKRIEAHARALFVRHPVAIEFGGDPRGGSTVTMTFRDVVPAPREGVPQSYRDTELAIG